MVLEIIAIGVGIYLLAKHKKNKRERAAAFAAGQPIHNQDGSVTYPPDYPGCPTHGETRGVGMRDPRPQAFYDQKRQADATVTETALPAYRDQPEMGQREEEAAPRYSMDGKKGGEVREIEVTDEKEGYVRV